MFTKKWNAKIYLATAFLGGVLALIGYSVYLTVTGQVSDENGDRLAPVWKIIFCVVIAIVGSSYLITFLMLIKQLLRHRSTAFTLDSNGIHNTLCIIMLFAFALVVPVKCIPWNAVKRLDTEDEVVSVHLNTAQVQTSWLGKLILAVRGYSFCYTFTTEPVSEEEVRQIAAYCKEKSPISSEE